jgi:malonate-semialdehyde dehydrogenase (acetylating)/methylmalonate-semialdehyde dehydrogenase
MSMLRLGARRTLGTRAYATAANTKAPLSGLSDANRARAESLSAWKGTSAAGERTKNYIGGEFVESAAQEWIDVVDPATQTLLTRVPETTKDEFDSAVDAASEAFKTWRRTSVLTRTSFDSARCMRCDLDSQAKSSPWSALSVLTSCASS